MGEIRVTVFFTCTLGVSRIQNRSFVMTPLCLSVQSYHRCSNGDSGCLNTKTKQGNITLIFILRRCRVRANRRCRNWAGFGCCWSWMRSRGRMGTSWRGEARETRLLASWAHNTTPECNLKKNTKQWRHRFVGTLQEVFTESVAYRLHLGALR